MEKNDSHSSEDIDLKSLYKLIFYLFSKVDILYKSMYEKKFLNKVHPKVRAFLFIFYRIKMIHLLMLTG